MISLPLGMNLFVVQGIRPDKGGVEDVIRGAFPYADHHDPVHFHPDGVSANRHLLAGKHVMRPAPLGAKSTVQSQA